MIHSMDWSWAEVGMKLWVCLRATTLYNQTKDNHCASVFRHAQKRWLKNRDVFKDGRCHNVATKEDLRLKFCCQKFSDNLCWPSHNVTALWPMTANQAIEMEQKMEWWSHDQTNGCCTGPLVHFFYIYMCSRHLVLFLRVFFVSADKCYYKEPEFLYLLDCKWIRCASWRDMRIHVAQSDTQWLLKTVQIVQAIGRKQNFSLACWCHLCFARHIETWLTGRKQYGAHFWLAAELMAVVGRQTIS